MAFIGRRLTPNFLIGAAITAFAGLVRFLHLGRPGREVFDEQFYARDACWYVFKQIQRCHLLGEPPEVHPPLGKWLIGIGIKLFGYEPFGARIMPWVAGTIAVALTFALARRLSSGLWPSAAAAGFMAVDPLHILHSRLAQLDIFVVTFMLAALMCAVVDADKRKADPTRGFLTPAVMLAALFCGAAIATKWVAIALWFMCALLIWWWARPNPPRLTPLPLVMTIVPLAAYVISYIGRLDASASEWFGVFWEQQSYMARYLAEELPRHLYQSQPWEWLVGQGPIVYDFEVLPEAVAEVVAVGNPLLYPLSVAAMGVASIGAIRQHGRDRMATLVAVGFLVTWMPWVVVSILGRGHLFVYYLLPTLPFMALGLAWLVTTSRGFGRSAVVILLGASLLLLGFLMPILTAGPLKLSDWRSRHLLHSVCPNEGEQVMADKDLVQLLNYACRGIPPPDPRP